MSLLDKATIITTPTAHSNGVLHSIKGGSVADFDVVRGSAATRVNAEGLIEDVATNIPRIDYTGGTASILLEPQSTNLIPYSNEPNQVGWFDSASVTLTDDFGVSPDGTINASKWSNTASSFPQMGRTISGLTIGESYTVSFYVKSDGTSQNQISTHFTGLSRVDFTPTSEWVRITNTIVATATSHLFLLFINSGAAPASSFLIYGFQFEALPYATSYIPTSGAIATRLADSVTGAGDATTFNSTEGVLYFEGSALANDLTNRIISITDGVSVNGVSLYYSSGSNVIRANYYVGGVAQCNLQYILADETDFSKIAFVWKINRFELWVDGVKRAEDLSGSVNTANTMNDLSFSRLFGNVFYGKVKSVITFYTALTDAELECLTTI